VISFFNKGKSFFGDLPFLHFCNKCDICNQHELTSGCCFGKKPKDFSGPFFVRYSQYIPTVASTEVTNGYLKNDLDLIFTGPI